MRFRRRSNVTDIEVARRAASGLGAYDNSIENIQATITPISPGALPKVIDHAPEPPRLYDDNGPLATVTELSASSVAERPALSVLPHVEGAGHSHFPSDVCPKCSGHIRWIDRGNHFDGRCRGDCGEPWSQFKPQEGDEQRAQTRTATWLRRIEDALGPAPHSMIKACAWIDELERDNRRLKSELYQAICQRDIARRQRDEARASGSGMAP